MSTDNTPPPRPSPGQTPEQAEGLRQIAERQGTLGKSSVESVRRAWEGLGQSEEEFERFLQLLREVRHDPQE